MNARNLFPILEKYTYLNTAASGLLSVNTYQWRQEHEAHFYQEGSNFRLYQAEFLETVREKIALFFNGTLAHTFLVPNFSFGWDALLNGLSKKHRFLLIENDYPSLVFPVKTMGFEWDEIAFNDTFEVQLFEKIKTYQPTILAVSLVQYINGLSIGADLIKRLKLQFPDLLILGDGTQYFGTQRFDFEASGLDAILGSGYKWMLGGYGNGFVLMKPSLTEQLYQGIVQPSVSSAPFWQAKSLLSYFFEPGHLDTLSFGTLKASIDIFDALGWNFIETRIQTLSQKAKAAFSDRGLLSHAQMAHEAITPIFNIAVDEKQQKAMDHAGVLYTPRGSGLRISFHFYNTENDLDHLLKALDES